MSLRILTVLDDWVTISLEPNILMKTKPQQLILPPDCYCWSKSFQQELDVITNKEESILYCQRSYKRLIALMNVLWRNSCSLEGKQLSLRTLYLEALEKMYDFGIDILHSHTNLFAPVDEPVSLYECHRFINEYRKLLDEHETMLKELLKEDYEVVDIMRRLLDVELDHARLTRHHIHYFTNLFHNMMKWFENARSDTVMALLAFLVYKNYNSCSCVLYFISCAKRQLNELKSTCARIEQLKCWHRDLSHLPEKALAAYNPNKRSLKKQLLKFIRDELQYHYSSCTTSTSKPREKHAQGTNQEFRAPRIKLNMSVPELAAFLKLGVVLKIIEAKSITDLLEYVCEHFCTIGTPVIKFKSLYNKYQEVEPATWEKVRCHLMDLDKLIIKLRS